LSNALDVMETAASTNTVTDVEAVVSVMLALLLFRAGIATEEDRNCGSVRITTDKVRFHSDFLDSRKLIKH
jgi:hypothetical protein